MDTNEIEIYSWERRPNKEQWEVNYWDGQEYRDEVINEDDLLQHIISHGLNELWDYPDYGDITPLDADTWLSDNYDTAIKHYILNR